MASKLREIVPDIYTSAHSFGDGIVEYNKHICNEILRWDIFGARMGSTFYFGFVTPVLNFSMGGIETNIDSQVTIRDGVTIAPT